MAAKSKKSDKTDRQACCSAPPAKGLLADVQNLMQMMAAHEVTEINIEDGPRKISLKRGGLMVPAAAAMPLAAPYAAPLPTAAAAPAAKEPSSVPAEKEKLLEIVSPMVGTFYAAPSPDSEPYVEVGSRVNPNTVVCIVEAMKVMNEIKAEVSGTIVEVCVPNAQPVEFGQVLFRVKP